MTTNIERVVGIDFDSEKHRSVTLAIAERYEAINQAHRPFYSRVKWENLPLNCQQEHCDIARAALNGETHEGKQLPAWVMGIAESSHRGNL